LGWGAALSLAACSSAKPTVTVDDEDTMTEVEAGTVSEVPLPPQPTDTQADDFIPTPSGDDDEGDPCAVPDAGCDLMWADAGPACGDGKVDPGELCDDGNTLPGDGCTGACTVEPNSSCPPTGGACTSTIQCGNGQVEGSEVCDDGNTSDGDGCANNCLSKDPNYDCSKAGEDCVNLVVCGDGVLEGDEPCDDGNAVALDGCSADCKTVEAGYLCLRPNEACVIEPRCGDGELTRGEECDDGNTDTQDGCSDACAVESGFYCSGSVTMCVQEICGDAVRTPSEQCDDGNTNAADGCSECQIDTGFVCPKPGDACLPRCGDGTPNGYEECDDGNTEDADGCGGGCLREVGYDCPSAGGACTQAVCGDGVRGGDEGCDDGNFNAGDGCGPTCQSEPTFDPTGVADLRCGDGLIAGTETCDDGNANDNDGCSASCQQEGGWTCSELGSHPESVDIAVTYRDFIGAPNTAGHPDFENACGDGNPNTGVCAGSDGLGIAGDVCTTDNADDCGGLDSERKPVRGAGTSDTIASADSFAQWYRDDADPDDALTIMTIKDALHLSRVGDATSDIYEYDDSSFFPLNDRGFGNTCENETVDSTMLNCCTGAGNCLDKNYHFTTELRYFFQYHGGETLTFRGDDDVFVYINGKLAVDVGGVHCVQFGRVVLGDADGTCSANRVDSVTTGANACTDPGTLEDCTATDAELAADSDARFGITKGGVYEIALFHAERHTIESNFRLTLQGFLPPRSVCSPVCGDGMLQRGEVCDDGADNVTADNAAYGKCVECRSRRFCGDGVKDEPDEICDNGLNISSYNTGADACAPGCVAPPDCGDGQTQPAFEDCDLGVDKNTGAYDGCTMSCDYGPFCGDGQLDTTFGEVCDAGNLNGGYGRPCGYDCKPAPRCGDGLRNGPEQCDDGDDANKGEYGGCNADCTLAPRCGDSQVQTDKGEQCDDGKNDGGYGECAPGCKIGPNCGDGQVQKEGGEECDDGKNTGDYGKCAPGCKTGPRCGDHIVQPEGDEECDDGPRGSNACTKTCQLPPKRAR
jgi:fibro-slime domain-containing protein